MRIKKFMAAALIAAGVMTVSAIAANAEADVVTVKVDNSLVSFDQNPIIVGEGYTMVPVRAVFEKAGCGVSWDDASKTATISKLGYTVNITANDDKMYKNGEAIALDAPAIIENSRVLIPVRAIAEAMDYAVTWDGHHSLVYVSTAGKDKPYRPYAFLKLGFMTVKDAAEYFCDSSGVTEIDLDCDGTKERLEFNQASDMSALAAPVLKINNLDYSVGLGSITSAYSIAVVDLADGDNSKEIIVTENGDVLTAHFYRYENGVVKPITAYDGNGAEITYVNHLLISGKGTDKEQASGIKKGYIISDLSGACFIDIMVTGVIYSYENSNISINQFDSLASIYERNLYKTYNDRMLYHVIYTDNYTPGAYKDVDGGVINQDDLSHFRILGSFVENTSSKYIELYVELDNGSRAVIKPYKT